MFEQIINGIHEFFCEKTKFTKLPDTFDDRHSDSGYFISPVPNIDFTQSTKQHVLKASKRFRIYIQYRNEDLHKLIAGLQYFFKCTKNGNVISLNDDSKLIFEDVTKNDYNVREFRFAFIEIELNDFLRASECVC